MLDTKVIKRCCQQLVSYGLTDKDSLFVIVDIATQSLWLVENQTEIARFVISSASKGVGQRQGSEQTPLGVHHIAEKIGEDVPVYSRFVSRALTGEIHPPIEVSEYSSEDVISSRILWLAGLERGVNKGEGHDSYDRYIYIHGTNEEWRLGTPASHGCIRMANQDVIKLFDKVAIQTLVVIVEEL